jgi:hypothetical protein
MTVKVVVPVVSQAARFRCVHGPAKRLNLGCGEGVAVQICPSRLSRLENTRRKLGSNLGQSRPENGLKPNKDIRIEKAAPHGAALVRSNPAMAGAQSRET